MLDLRDLPLVAGSGAPRGEYRRKACLPSERHAARVVRVSPEATVRRRLAAGAQRDGDRRIGGGDVHAQRLRSVSFCVVFGRVQASDVGDGFESRQPQLEVAPKPGNSEVLYDLTVSLAYVTLDGVKAVADEIEAKFLADGWEPYGTAGDTRFYRKNAIRLLAATSAAPAQEGKTVVTYFTELLSAELPAPRDAKRMQYSEPPVQLSLDFAGDLTAADKWYREQLGNMGWEPTTENPVKEGFEYFVIYRNKAGEMLEITLQEVDHLMRLQMEYTTAEELAEMERRWEEQRKKAEASK